ncbi:hypothetical protein DPMN_127959 [Dreissena polymorpha]|uniref:Uncharacterized protein n=1 Tax=Dreissena polymorpha TaxID=45954 RepID=A0A9D4JZP0_DREPO|nr:hypothetical protein DPMN_127959 [Dreissena polymorpha]
MWNRWQPTVWALSMCMGRNNGYTPSLPVAHAGCRVIKFARNWNLGMRYFPEMD